MIWPGIFVNWKLLLFTLAVVHLASTLAAPRGEGASTGVNREPLVHIASDGGRQNARCPKGYRLPASTGWPSARLHSRRKVSGLME